MCDSRQPLEGADSRPPEQIGKIMARVVHSIYAIQCGQWVERGMLEGFCSLPPDHDGRCQPPPYEAYRA